MIQVEDKNTTLISDKLRLIPFRSKDDYDYLLRIAKAHTLFPYSDSQADELFNKYCKYAWVGYINGKQSGVVYLAHYEVHDIWTLSGFGDKEGLKGVKDRLGYMEKACNLVMDSAFQNFTNMIYAFHDKRNKSVIRVFKRLGFKYCQDDASDGCMFELYLRRK